MLLPELRSFPPLPDEVLVSIVTPNRNYGHLLPDYLRSLGALHHRHWEAIVVDDGSTDDSVEVLERAAASDQRIRVLQQANAGTLACLATALPHVRGQIVLLVDSDDEVLPDRCAAVISAFRSNPRASLVIHPLYVIDTHRSVIGVMPLGGELPHGDLRARLFAAGGSLQGMGVTSGFAVHREALHELSTRSFIPSEGTNVDELLRRCLPLLGEVAAIDRPLGLRRIHSANHSAHRSLSLLATVERGLQKYALLLEAQQQLATELGCSPYLDHEHDPDMLAMRYVLARLTRHDLRQRERSFFGSSAFTAMSRSRRWYWTAVRHSPGMVARWMIGSLYSPLGLKPLLNHVRFRRSGHRPPPDLVVAATTSVVRQAFGGRW